MVVDFEESFSISFSWKSLISLAHFIFTMTIVQDITHNLHIARKVEIETDVIFTNI